MKKNKIAMLIIIASVLLVTGCSSNNKENKFETGVVKRTSTQTHGHSLTVILLEDNRVIMSSSDYSQILRKGDTITFKENRRENKEITSVKFKD